MTLEEKSIAALREKMEKKIGRHIETPKDYDLLSQSVTEECREHVSANTLKRLYGYLNEGRTPRLSTLNILSQYVGYRDWKDFCEKLESEPQEEPTGESTAQQPEKSRRCSWKCFLAILLVAMAAAVLTTLHFANKSAKECHILKMGTRFPDYESYLALFGITDLSGQPWSKSLPHVDNIIVFGGMYDHPSWGNLGDTTQLMPTRTERLNPSLLDNKHEHEKLRGHYFAQLESNHLMITFMRNMPDSTFVYCGVYRVRLHESDTTQVVWERVAEDIDLDNLESLLRLRNPR